MQQEERNFVKYKHKLICEVWNIKFLSEQNKMSFSVQKRFFLIWAKLKRTNLQESKLKIIEVGLSPMEPIVDIMKLTRNTLVNIYLLAKKSQLKIMQSSA